jgi:hypothetical protein
LTGVGALAHCVDVRGRFSDENGCRACCRLFAFRVGGGPRRRPRPRRRGLSGSGFSGRRATEQAVRPAVPSCVNEARGTHNCGNRALNAYEVANREYQQAFNAYVAQVNSYLQKLQAYTRQAVTYAECERDVVLPSTLING